MDVESFLRQLPIGAVFAQPNVRQLPDSWVKIDTDSYRRTYDWIPFSASDLANTWTSVQLTEPVPGSFDQEEADRRRREDLSRRSSRKMDN